MLSPRDGAVGVDLPSSIVSSAISRATAAAAAAAAATTTEASSGGPFNLDTSEGECRLLGPFALLVQAALGGLALLSLVYKRWRERPQRPVKIWFFDVSKQVFGSVLVHIANIFMSMLTSGRLSIKLVPSSAHRLMMRDEDDYIPNPCSFYLLNLAIDTTLGIPILIILLRIFTAAAALTPFGKPTESIQSGHYGSPPNAVWWLKQSIIYFTGLFGMKVCVLIIFIMIPWISQVGDWALSWTEGNERLQIAFVMMIFPLIMNAMQYYTIDSFIKKKVEHEAVPTEDVDDSFRIYDSNHFSGDESDDDDSDGKSDGRATPKPVGRPRANNETEYDPEVDGDAPTILGSGSSGHATISKGAISKELLPKE